MTVRNTKVLDSLLLQKEAGFFDFLSPPTFMSSPPVLGMARTKSDDLRKTQQKEFELWQQWNTSGRTPDLLQPLHNSFKPIINQHVRKWSGADVPNSAIYHEMNKQFVNAVKTYDPNKGTQLGTWVTKNLSKAGRFVKNYQNLGHIPEAQISKIRAYDKAKEELTSKLGHEPDTRTIAEFMKEPVKRIAQLEKERREDLSASRFQSDPAQILVPKELEALTLIQYDLPSEERLVYEYTFGMNGKPMLKPGEISSKTGLHPSKVSRIRKKLQGKVREAMEYL
jgi:DNA-directed RNA polymerase specialized sigma subunit